MSDSGAAGSDDFLDVMRDTRARYVAGFADQLDHMRSLIAQTGEGRLAALRTIAHRMAGLSGTLGFQTVGAAAADLEALVEAAHSSDAFSRDAALALIQRIGDAFRADLATPPSWASQR